MKANTRLIKVLVPSVIAVIIIAVVSIMIVRGNNKDSSVSENPTTAPAVEEKQTTSGKIDKLFNDDDTSRGDFENFHPDESHLGWG